jgi:hypothetical protein
VKLKLIMLLAMLIDVLCAVPGSSPHSKSFSLVSKE